MDRCNALCTYLGLNCIIKSKIMQFRWQRIAFILFSLTTVKMYMLQIYTIGYYHCLRKILLQKFSEAILNGLRRD